MASVSTLQSIVSETDDTQLAILYQQFYKELGELKSTFEENEYLQDNTDESLQTLIRHTSLKVNSNISNNTLLSILPVVGFFLNSASSKNKQMGDNFAKKYASYFEKLYANTLNIIQKTTDLDVCIRALFIYQNMFIDENLKMNSWFISFYESTFEFLNETCRFMPTKPNKKDLNQICVLRMLTLRAYTSLFYNSQRFNILLERSKQWLHSVVLFLICDHGELQETAIDFLLRFIDYVKRMDGVHAIQYPKYKHHITSNKLLFQTLESIIIKNEKNKKDPDANTIYKFKTKAHNNSENKRRKNLKIWSICVLLLGANCVNDQNLINRLLKYFSSFLSSSPAEAFEHFRDFMFVMNLKPKALKDRKCLALFMKVLSSGFSAKAKRALSVRLECLKTWSYAICALSKHNLLFYDDKKGNIPFKTLVTPFMELVETKNLEMDLSQRIINVMTQLLTTNVNENENRLMTPCDVDMKDMEDPNGENETASIPTNGNEFGRDNDDGMVINYQWKFSNWSVAMNPILTFCTRILKLHGNEESTKCISTFIQTFFRTMEQRRLSKKLPNKYLEQIILFLAKICVMEKAKDQILQRQSLKYSSIVIGDSFQHLSKYKENIKKLKCKSLNDTSFGLKLDDCNKNICLYLMKLWLTECDKYGIYPLSDIYAQ